MILFDDLTNAEIKKICVFCGANSGASEEYVELAKNCGRLIGEQGMSLIYGGGDSGLMGAVSKSAKSHGASVTGVFPVFIEEHEHLNHDLDNTIFVDNMFKRKEIFIKRSDLFLFLPGGLGTLDEFFEVITLKTLKQLHQPIIIVNYKHYWDPLLQLCAHVVKNEFASERIQTLYEHFDTLEDAFKHIKQL